ncbi:hypothetical protein [Streptomyces pacificus]|uniref:Uncharacterized protein n=1 Tax=Streptomyces pacificus TaxID=2705029 RepID=A0A6A0AZI9_9ACTN|nr:hypothetical protein [Streptomyces pacificus]GFH38306.1 hypothetical protein SCWH03_45480 [Streptomyces pacificus]
MTDPGLPPYAKHPEPPATHRPPPSYRAPGLIPPSGPSRTWGLAVTAAPLLLALMTTLTGSLAEGSTSSASPGSSGSSASSGSSGSSGRSGSGVFGSDSFGSDRARTSDHPTRTPPTTGPAWRYGGTDTPDAPPTPEATTTGSYRDDGYADPTGTAPGTPGAANATRGPGDVVTAYFEAINKRDYRTAWALGGSNLESGYDRFVSGYADTERNAIEIRYVQGTRVRLTIEALQSDGSTRSYNALYTVRGGVISSGTATRTD